MFEKFNFSSRQIKNYFEFYPLHVVYKMKDRKKKKIRFKRGDTVEIPEKNEIKVV